ncbi:MAG: TetR/AcrR family transcriptional regulator [Polyangiaceae bacterium]
MVPRIAKFSDDQLIEAARQLILEGGPGAATVNAIASRVGAPVGSVYHRFRSRELILAHVLLDAVAAFQQPYLEFASRPEATPGEIAAHFIEWVVAHPEDAKLLALYRRSEFLSGAVPEELRARADRLQTEIYEWMRLLCRRWFGRVSQRAEDAVRLALLEIPYGAVRGRLGRSERFPEDLARLVAAAADAVIASAKET